MKLRSFYVYILTNERDTVNYIGVTNDLARRIDEHRSGVIRGFTWQYNIKKLVYYELCDTAEQAIAREKQLKRWHREWKLNLIRAANPSFHDLYEHVNGVPKQVRDDGK